VFQLPKLRNDFVIVIRDICHGSAGAEKVETPIWSRFVNTPRLKLIGRWGLATTDPESEDETQNGDLRSPTKEVPKNIFGYISYGKIWCSDGYRFGRLYFQVNLVWRFFNLS
jgi:hypothetical protein